MINVPLSIQKFSGGTPIHVFIVESENGDRRRLAIPGRYTESRVDRAKAKLRVGERIVDQTWRSDWRYLDHPAGGDDYTG